MTDFEKALEENAEKSSKESCDSKYEWKNYEEIFYAGARWAREFTVREIVSFLSEEMIARGYVPIWAEFLESHFKDRGGE